MKFLRADLIKQVKDEIQRRTDAAAKATADAVARTAKSRDEYLASTSDDWLLFAARIEDAVRQGRPVTAEDIPQRLCDGWGDRFLVKRADYWAPPTPHEPDTDALRTLLDLLEAATDDAVSTTSLERSGFRMARLFRTR